MYTTIVAHHNFIWKVFESQSLTVLSRSSPALLPTEHYKGRRLLDIDLLRWAEIDHNDRFHTPSDEVRVSRLTREERILRFI